MDVAGAIALAIGILGVSGVIFTALKYNRDDTTAIVNQQNMIVSEMQTLNNELRATVVQLRAEKVDLQQQVDAMRLELRDG